MEKEILQNIGFTPAEATVYLTLINYSPCKVGLIIEKSGLQSSTIHNILHNLQEKGYISYILKGKIKIYQATDPRVILKSFQEKEKQFAEIIPQLQTKQKQEKPKAEIYEGKKGLLTMLNVLIEDAKKGDYFYFFSVDVEQQNKEIQQLFEIFDAKRAAKGLIVRGIARKQLMSLYKKRKTLQMHYVDFPIPTNISICKNKIALISWKEKEINSILLTSPQLVKSQISFFEELWRDEKDNNYKTEE